MKALTYTFNTLTVLALLIILWHDGRRLLRYTIDGIITAWGFFQ